MVKHIVLFKLKDEVPEAEKLVVMNKFKEAIEALPAKISVIRKIEVGLESGFHHLREVLCLLAGFINRYAKGSQPA